MLTLLVSDLHLHPARTETARLFVEFLAGPAREAQALYILGDLFDAWAGDDDIDDPFNRSICNALAALDIAKFFLPGNRDFLVGDGFAAATGVTPIADETVTNIGGVPTLLLHGDTLCTDDADYQSFRATVRAPRWRDEFLILPLAERKARIEALRARSETEKRVKTHELMDVNRDAMTEAFRRHKVDRVIHGHTHRQARHEYDIDGRSRERWVLGEWNTDGSVLACDADGCRWLVFHAAP